MTPDQRRELFEREIIALTDAELIEVLRDLHTAEPIPECRICGGQLSVARMGGGAPTEWACSPYEDDPDDPRHLRRKADRGIADGHYSSSHYIQNREQEPWVLELVRRYEMLKLVGYQYDIEN